MLCGPNRAPFAQKSAYGAPGGGTGIGMIERSLGCFSFEMSTSDACPRPSRQSSAIASEFTHTRFRLLIGRIECTGMPPSNGRGEIKMADRRRLADVADVEDEHPGAAVIEIQPVAVDDGRSVDLHAVLGLLARRHVLARRRPSRDFHGLRRILDVDDHEELVLVAGQRSGREHVAAAGIAVAMGAAAAGLPLTELLSGSPGP